MNDPSKPMARRTAYIRRHPDRRKLTNKLAWIKFKHGDAAKKYFEEHHICEQCTEDRIACLGIHHTHGKHVEKFETLCANCHQIEHGGSYTYKDVKNNEGSSNGKTPAFGVGN